MTGTITVVTKRHPKKTDCRIYIGRGSPLGNPFTSIKDRQTKAQHVCDSREESITKYQEYINHQIEIRNPAIIAELKRIKNCILNNIHVELECFCAPRPCHGDIIKQIVNDNVNTYLKTIGE